MKKIDDLKIKSLFKQIDYLMSEIEWKEEFISDKDEEFKKCVRDILESNSELMELYDRVQRESIESVKRENFNIEEEIGKEVPKKDKKLKSLYREIVKQTHPDKVDDEKLNELYLEATDKYEEDDIFSIYKICSKLGIEYEFSEEEKYLLESQVSKLKGRIKFMENSYTWNWGNTDDEKYKEKIIIDFIKQMV